jgi:hypothetical protein
MSVLYIAMDRAICRRLSIETIVLKLVLNVSTVYIAAYVLVIQFLYVCILPPYIVALLCRWETSLT